MKRILIVLPIVLLCFFPSTITGMDIHHAYNASPATIEEITLRDDAFHGRGSLPFIEWWYFDAEFDNGYSLTVGVHIFKMFTRGIVSTRFTVYDHGSLLLKNYQKYTLADFSASSEVPSVFIAGDQLIYGSIDSMDHFVYNVTIRTSQGSVSLHFVGCTDGWKRQQNTGDWWAVILPRATVTGTLTIQNTTMNVTGTGYHDHNWGVNPFLIMHFGWLWGTCRSSHYTVTWAQIYPTRFKHLPIMVVNVNDNGYLDIPAKTIWFSVGDFTLDHFKRVPHFFNIETVTEHVFLIINMEVVDVDYTQLLGFIHYWRYQVRCTGTIVIDGDMETVDSVSIMEYLRFR